MQPAPLEGQKLPVPGVIDAGEYRITAVYAEKIENTPDTFTVCPEGTIFIRARRGGDTLRLPGGTKSLKKLFIDRKIPAAERDTCPVIEDAAGILGVYGIGTHLDRAAKTLPAVTIQIHKRERGE